jgi:hypothetical protein
MAESREELGMSAMERDRLKILHEVKKRHITKKQAAAELGLSVRWVRALLVRRREPYSQVDVSLDTSQFHSGTRALRLVFSGPAFSDSGVSQYVPVQPNIRYRLSTFVRSEDIVSASGPRIVVQDYYGNQVLASTDDLLSTSGWRELLADFTTGPQTRLIAIKVMRVPGNPLIKGTFWLDDVKLTLAQTAAADH